MDTAGTITKGLEGESDVHSHTVIAPAAEMNQNQLFNTIAAILDVRTGRQIASTRVPEALFAVGGASDLVHSAHQESVGHVITTIRRLQIRPRDSGGAR